MIYVDGRLVGGSGGHAWIIDGYGYYQVHHYEEPTIQKTLFHCDWGWGGEDNGYYLSDLFNTRYGDFEDMKYFSVKTDL